MNYTIEQQKVYLEALGYTVDKHDYKEYHSETRSSEAYEIDLSVMLAFKGKKNDAIKTFVNEGKYCHASKVIMEHVFISEFYGRLYNAMLIQAQQTTLK